MNAWEPTWRGVVKKARSGSGPGPNGIAYIVYKKFPKLLRKFFQIHTNIQE